jgi:hypothetical protein
MQNQSPIDLAQLCIRERRTPCFRTDKTAQQAVYSHHKGANRESAQQRAAMHAFICAVDAEHG